MARDGAVYACQSCGAVQTKWSGQCSGCGAWNTLVEEVQARPPGALAPARGAAKGRGLNFEGLEDDAQTRSHVAAAVCADQVLDLTRRGIGDFHFYTMNRADLAFAICHMIGIRPDVAAAGPVLAPAAA